MKKQLCSRCKRELDSEFFELLERTNREDLIKGIKKLYFELQKKEMTK